MTELVEKAIRELREYAQKNLPLPTMKDDEVKDALTKFVTERGKAEYWSMTEQVAVRNGAYSAIRGLGILDELLDDEKTIILPQITKGYFDNWKTYTAGTDIEITPFVEDCFEPVPISEDYPNKYWMTPITLCFKDNCGNIDYMLLTVPNWYDFSAFAFRFDVKDISK